MTDKKTRTSFIAQCGDKYLYEWAEPQFTSYMWYDTHTEFSTKEECLKAVSSTMRHSDKPNAPIIIKELRETVITEVVNEEIL